MKYITLKPTVALLTILCGLFLLTGCGSDSPQKTYRMEGQELGYEMGGILQARQPGVRVVVMTRPGLENSPLVEMEISILEGLEEGLGTAPDMAEAIVRPEQLNDIEQQAEITGISDDELDSYRASMLHSTSTWYDVKNLRDFLETHKHDADMVISMIGLPEDLTVENFPDGSGLPALAALNLTAEEAVRLLERQKGWLYQAMRPEGRTPRTPGVDIQEIGKQFLLLYPSMNGR
ncbi:MAG: hypothetical protein PF795_07180 [Kiritimatiellae bacterium]|jgi:hypothetical protein|nr:hypothetical protein [Kiritimatiellia bacterium]